MSSGKDAPSLDSPQSAYAWLCEHSRATADLESTAALLHWDQRTYIPAKGHEHRSSVLAQLAGMVHERQVDPRRGEVLDYLEGSDWAKDAASPEAANIREWRRDFDRTAKIPQSLAVELAKSCSVAETAWEQARPKNDWKGFFPHLERILELKRQEAEAVGYDSEPYDALLDDYEPDERAARLEPLFATLRTAIVDLLGRLEGAPKKPDASCLSGEFPIEPQRDFSLEVVGAFGYDLEAGRLDVTAHPFSITIGPGDSRITTRFRTDHFNEAFFSVMHEAGHGMYEQGLEAQHWGAPMGQAVSLGVHESQSRLWENMVARSPAFWKHYFPIAQQRFTSLAEVSQDDFVRAVNEVKPGLIRVDADEVCYNLHVLLRFELELALFRGDLAAADLPEAWNDKMQSLLGITPPDMASGVLQDVHWSAGLIGYFPTYTLGNLYAAQLFQAAGKELGSLEEMIGAGEFAPLLGWLRKNIHSHGRRLRPRALVQQATGEEPDAAYLIAYLNEKFGEVYGL